MNELLFLIPARGGSKGIPGKNIRPLGGKPLINYSIDYARLFTDDINICVSTDDESIVAVVRDSGLPIHFMRPAELATDNAGSYEVIRHALNYYTEQGRNYDAVVLLQPTSPLREKKHLEEALVVFETGCDMVVSVKEAKANPYYNLFEETADGSLQVSKGSGNYTRRQDVPPVYEYNGSIYIISTAALSSAKSFREFSAVRKYVMEEQFSVDIDDLQDWTIAEFLLGRK